MSTDSGRLSSLRVRHDATGPLSIPNYHRRELGPRGTSLTLIANWLSTTCARSSPSGWAYELAQRPARRGLRQAGTQRHLHARISGASSELEGEVHPGSAMVTPPQTG